MKKKFVAFALLICAIVSVTSGCIVREGHGGRGGHGGYPHSGHHYNRGY